MKGRLAKINDALATLGEDRLREFVLTANQKAMGLLKNKNVIALEILRNEILSGEDFVARLKKSPSNDFEEVFHLGVSAHEAPGRYQITISCEAGSLGDGATWDVCFDQNDAVSVCEITFYWIN